MAVAAAGLKARPSIDATPKEAVMRVVALISWIVTALAGATLFGIWVARGGPRRQGAGATRFPPPLIFGHTHSWPPPA